MKYKVPRLGIIGGGQLGMFLAKSAKKLKIKTFIYSDTKDAPAKLYAEKIYYGSFSDTKKLESFAKKVDVLTYEFENISIRSLSEINKETKIYPPIKALSITQDREKEKKFFEKNNILHAGVFYLNKKIDLQRNKKKFNFPLILKKLRFGYDGKGQHLLKNYKELEIKWSELNYEPCIIEKKINLKQELSIICARDLDKNIFCFPAFRNIHKNHILFETYSPANIAKKTEDELINISKKIIKKLKYTGILTIEFFIDKNENIYANELAPRVHNSGHITLDNAEKSQFDLHIMSIIGMKINSFKIKKKGLMRNLIGREIKQISKIRGLKRYNSYSRSKKYNYGKKVVKDGRKMGHINFTET